MTEIFSYLVFQPAPHREQVFIYLDGDPKRIVLRLSEFTNLVMKRHPQLLAVATEACRTYSFYLWSIPDGQIVSLPPRTENVKEESVFQPLYDQLYRHKKKKETEPETLTEKLNTLGFEDVSAESTAKLRVQLSRLRKERLPFFRLDRKNTNHK